MSTLGNAIKRADFKLEKHAPLIEIAGDIKSGEIFSITASVGKDIRHPNTTEHFISSIELWFKPEGSGSVISLGRSEFNAHGESASGANQGPAFTEPSFTTKVQLKASGTLIATAYCNIHGLWESEKEFKIAD